MRCLRLLLFLVGSALYSQTGYAQSSLTLTQITTVSEPVDITGAGDGSNRLFIVNKDGIIRIYNLATSTLLPASYLDISARVLNGGERGLLGLTFDPSFTTNGRFYVNYIHMGTGNTRISRFTASLPFISNNTVDPTTEVILLDIPQPFGTNHKGGDLNFGPDGFLYIAMGDGGGSPGTRAQDLQTLLGKVLRIDVNGTSPGLNYGIPASNPFVGTAGARGEIWALGLRNPWRFSFDRLTGDLWIADVGQSAWEEVNFQPSGTGGQNYGWQCHEGNHPYVPANCTVSFTPPVFEYGRNLSNGGYSVTGGFVYRGSALPALYGQYVVADFGSANFWLLQSNGTNQLLTDVAISEVVSFGEDDNAELYVSSLGGAVYRISGAVVLPIDLLRFSGTHQQDRIQLNWTTATERNADYFQVEKQTESGDFSTLGKVEAVGESRQQQRYRFDDLQAAPGNNTYRLRMVDLDGRIQYSPVTTVMVRETTRWQLSPNPATDKVTLSINSERELPALKFEIYNAQGRLVLEQEQVNPVFPFQQDFRLTGLPSGVYACRFEVDGKTEVQRLIIQ